MAAWNVPLVGDSLSDVTRQYGDWQRYNLGTEAANIKRRNEAEEFWNQQVAQRDQEAYRRQQIEQQRELDAQQRAREQYRWETARADAAARDALSAKLERERIAAQYGQRDTQEARALAEEANVANNLAQPIAESGARLDAANADYQQKSTALHTAVGALTTRFGTNLIKFDPTKNVRAFKAIAQANDADKKRAEVAAFEANTQIADLANQHSIAEQNLEMAQNEFGVHQQRLGKNLTWAKRNGQYVVVNLTGQPGRNEYRWNPPPKPAPPRSEWEIVGDQVAALRARHAAEMSQGWPSPETITAEPEPATTPPPAAEMRPEDAIPFEVRFKVGKYSGKVL